jgi:hypothetical protein
MPIDLSQIKKKLTGPQDGQDVVRLRVGTVSAVNSDGTVDVTISGIVVPSVPRLQGAVVAVGAVVQLTSYRGSLMVLGLVATDDVATYGNEPFVRASATSDSSAITSTEAVVLTLASRTYKSGRAYIIWAGGGQAYSANSAFSSWNVKKGTTTAGATVVSYPRQSNGAATTTLEQHLNLQQVFAVTGGSDVTTQMVLTLAANGANNATHKGSAVNPRHLTVLPAGRASAWSNPAVLS